MIDALAALRAPTVGSPTSVKPTVGAPVGPSQTGPVSAVPGQDFTSTLSAVASQALDNLKAGEAMAISGVQGKASAQNVVEAVMQAEQTLSASIAVRNKVVEAYQEISRMSI